MTKQHSNKEYAKSPKCGRHDMVHCWESDEPMKHKNIESHYTNAAKKEEKLKKKNSKYVCLHLNKTAAWYKKRKILLQSSGK